MSFSPGSKRRNEDERNEGIATNRSAAGSSYEPPRFDQVNRTEGLPWGEYSMTGVGSGTSARTDSNASPKSSTNVQKASHNPRW